MAIHSSLAGPVGPVRPSTTPRVSVGLMTYNRPDGLRRMLQALCGQTHSNLEIIVSDNASTDPRTAAVIAEFAERDARIRPFRQPHNLGVWGNLRFVYEQATSEYFMWAADDDLCDPEFVEVCLANLRAPENRAALSFCHVRKSRDDGSIIDTDFADPIGSASSSMLIRSFRYLYHSGGNHAFYGLYRRAAINFWFFERRFGNDHLALLTLLRSGNIHVDRRVLFTSTVGGTGFDRKNFHKYYPHDAIGLKVAVNLSSTLTWMYEFLRCIWLTPYKPHEKVALWAFTFVRFARPRYWRRFAGDMRALFTRRDIWNFKER